jgi:hypothetical protein
LNLALGGVDGITGLKLTKRAEATDEPVFKIVDLQTHTLEGAGPTGTVDGRNWLRSKPGSKNRPG